MRADREVEALVDLALDDAGNRAHRARQVGVDPGHPEALVHRSNGERDAPRTAAMTTP